MLNGMGIFIFVYEKNYKNGVKHGHGNWIHPDGDTYRGKFKSGVKRGRGVYTFKNGEEYKGDYKRDQQHGIGQYTFNNGEIFAGGVTNLTRMDIAYNRNGNDRGEYAFNESEYGGHNPYGYKEKGSGDERSFQNELEEVVYNFGIEYNYTDNFTLRAGFIYDLEGEIKSPTVGAGVKFNNYGFDFGYTSGPSGHPRANTMFFSLSLGL